MGRSTVPQASQIIYLMMMIVMIALFSIQHTVHMKRVEQEVQDLYKALPIEQSSEK